MNIYKFTPLKHQFKSNSCISPKYRAQLNQSDSIHFGTSQKPLFQYTDTEFLNAIDSFIDITPVRAEAYVEEFERRTRNHRAKFSQAIYDQWSERSAIQEYIQKIEKVWKNAGESASLSGK